MKVQSYDLFPVHVYCVLQNSSVGILDFRTFPRGQILRKIRSRRNTSLSSR